MEKREWEIKTKIVYEDDYKTEKGYESACARYEGDDWIYITSSTGWDGHGGYSMYQKIEE